MHFSYPLPHYLNLLAQFYLKLIPKSPGAADEACSFVQDTWVIETHKSLCWPSIQADIKSVKMWSGPKSSSKLHLLKYSTQIPPFFMILGPWISLTSYSDHKGVGEEACVVIFISAPFLLTSNEYRLLWIWNHSLFLLSMGCGKMSLEAACGDKISRVLTQAWNQLSHYSFWTTVAFSIK